MTLKTATAWAGDPRWGTSDDPARWFYALSLFQPWAALVVSGNKMIETRSWPTKHRGRILIHAGKAEVDYPDGVARLIFDCWGGAALLGLFPRGAIVGAVSIVGCFPIEADPGAHSRAWRVDGELVGLSEYLLGDYRAGRWGWVLADPVVFARPIPFRGRQRLFRVPREVVSAAEEAT